MGNWKGMAMLNTMLAAGTVMFVMTAIFSSLLAVAKEALHVDEDPRVREVMEALPQANCGACGFAGCADFAEAVVEGLAKHNGCPVGGPKVAEAISGILGIDTVETDPFRPIIHCCATTENRLGRVPTEGVHRCVEANQLGATQACTYGCLGFGDCVQACNFDALHMVDGLPEVDYATCIGCGLCVSACPRDLIELIPFKQVRMPAIACANREAGRFVRQVCRTGCIGCGICHRLSPDIFHISDNLAILDYAQCTGAEDASEAIEECPTKVITYVGDFKHRSTRLHCPQLEHTLDAAC